MRCPVILENQQRVISHDAAKRHYLVSYRYTHQHICQMNRPDENLQGLSRCVLQMCSGWYRWATQSEKKNDNGRMSRNLQQRNTDVSLPQKHQRTFFCKTSTFQTLSTFGWWNLHVKNLWNSCFQNLTQVKVCDCSRERNQRHGWPGSKEDVQEREAALMQDGQRSSEGSVCC